MNAGCGRAGAMKKRQPLYILLPILLLAWIAGCDVGQGEARGRARFNNCSPCHGQDGAGNRDLGAPAIAGLPAWYVEAQLRSFQDGVRGAHPSDDAGLRMRPMARTLRGNDDIVTVAAYVEHLQGPKPESRVVGDAAKGKSLYQTCAACHGERAEGKKDQAAPDLVKTSDWYLLGQLEKFKKGIRGTVPGDAKGAQMRAAVATLADEAAMKDVIAYIQTLH